MDCFPLCILFCYEIHFYQLPSLFGADTVLSIVFCALFYYYLTGLAGTNCYSFVCACGELRFVKLVFMKHDSKHAH